MTTIAEFVRRMRKRRVTLPAALCEQFKQAISPNAPAHCTPDMIAEAMLAYMALPREQQRRWVGAVDEWCGEEFRRAFPEQAHEEDARESAYRTRFVSAIAGVPVFRFHPA